MKTTSTRRGVRAFTLVELLVVFGLIAFLVGAATMSASSLGRAGSMTTAGSNIKGEWELARNTAIARNVSVAFCFYKVEGAWRSYASFLWNDEMGWQPLRPPQTLPERIKIAPLEMHSSLPLLLADPSIGDDVPPTPEVLKRMGATESRYFTFLPSGKTDLDPNGRWSLTLHGAHDLPANVSSSLPSNWLALYLDPLGGRVKLVRP